MSDWIKLRFEVFKRDNFSCQYCGRNVQEDKVKIVVDHIIPKGKGGRNIPSNLVVSCQDCNQGKGDVLLNNKLLK
ncbi:MAG: HNH endonuclease [Parcubacteria group bacterium]|nr:HNH endonuclease [Parcubacteria group bacterium]